MTTSTNRAVKLLQGEGIVRTRDLQRAGVSRTQLQRLVERGFVDRVGRGLYSAAGAVLTERHHLAEVARRISGGVVCLLSVLRFHDLTTQNPFEVWMAIGDKAWRPRLERPPLRLVYLSGSVLQEGVEEHDIGGVPVRVFSAAKTVADCFKFRNKIGTDVAIEALRDYRRLHPQGLEELWNFAVVDRVTRVIRPYLEAVGCVRRRSRPITPPR